MTKLIKSFFTFLTGRTDHKTSDFSAFFLRPSGDKAKVIRQVLREANEEQRKVMKEYRAKITA